jgi:hypothetical protein
MARKSDGTFKEGHTGFKPKGAISHKTKVWNEISEWFTGEGIEAYQVELMKLKDQKPEEYLKRFEAMLEYFQPKLSRSDVDVTSKGDKITPPVTWITPNESV